MRGFDNLFEIAYDKAPRVLLLFGLIAFSASFNVTLCFSLAYLSYSSSVTPFLVSSLNFCSWRCYCWDRSTSSRRRSL